MLVPTVVDRLVLVVLFSNVMVDNNPAAFACRICLRLLTLTHVSLSLPHICLVLLQTLQRCSVALLRP